MQIWRECWFADRSWIHSISEWFHRPSTKWKKLWSTLTPTDPIFDWKHLEAESPAFLFFSTELFRLRSQGAEGIGWSCHGSNDAGTGGKVPGALCETLIDFQCFCLFCLPFSKQTCQCQIKFWCWVQEMGDSYSFIIQYLSREKSVASHFWCIWNHLDIFWRLGSVLCNYFGMLCEL